MSNTLAVTPVPAALQAVQPAAAPAQSGHSGFSFHDFINIINPLQHIPVIGTIYREITGDTMKPISTILGGALFGGVVGLATSAVDAIVQEATGEDIGAHIMATLGLHHDSTHAMAQAAAAPTAAQGKPMPVPAFLVAEARADRAARGGAAPVGTLQPTQFWRSLQRGGSGVTHGSAGRPVITIGPPRSSSGGSAGGAIPGAAPLSPTPDAPASASQPTLQPPPSAAVSVLSSPSAALLDGIQQKADGASTQVATTAAGAIQPLPRDQIPEKMMQALAKYEAMHKQPQAQVVDQVN